MVAMQNFHVGFILTVIKDMKFGMKINYKYS